MVYTSYFASRKYDKDNAISIARWSPKWFSGKTAPELFPPKDLLLRYKNGEVTNEEYIKVYKEQVLNKLDPTSIAKKLDGLVLLCYEKSGDFCHRHIISKWLNENGFECKEL